MDYLNNIFYLFMESLVLVEFGYLFVGIALPNLVTSSELVRVGFASCLHMVACPDSTSEVQIFSLVVPQLVFTSK